MLRGVLALLERSLRVDARSWQVHLARIGLMLGIYIALVMVLASAFRFGAPGLRFFYSIIWLNVAFMTLLGIGFFSTTISEEKEEDTLGLMQMAGISSLGILLGKLGGRLVQSLLLIAVQYPFTLLAVTMGGVTQNQIRCSFVGLTAYMLFLAGLGIVCSTISARNRSSSTLMILGLIMYFAIPYAAYETHRSLIKTGMMSAASTEAFVLQWIASTCMFLQIAEIMTSSFGDSPWSIQVISNLTAGGLCFAIAWAAFGICTRNPASESLTRGFLTRKRGPFRWFSPGRPRLNPFLWKDFHFVGGGFGMILIRIGFYIALFFVFVMLTELWWPNAGRGLYPFEMAISMYQFFGLLFVTLDFAWLVSRTLHDEVRGQTLSSLCMLPESMPVISYSKFAGALLAGMPGIFALGFVCFATDAGRHNTGEFLERGPGWFFLAHFLLIPHLATSLSLYMRWGFIPMAIGLSIGSLFGWITFFQCVSVGPDEGLVNFAAFMVTAFCLACHFWVQYRIHALESRV